MSQEGTAQVVRGLPAFNDPNLIVGAEGFSDAGAYKLRDDLLIVQSLDFFPPLVDDPFTYGQIAAANALSDVFAMGARPVTALNIVGFPDKELDLEILSEILRGGAERVALAGAVIAGGHTVRDAEIKYGLSVTGVVAPDKLITNAGARPGDALVLTKALGTGFVTTAAKKNDCPDDVLARAIESMIQLNSIGRDAAIAHGAHAVTDITGFGLAGHAGEMARASGVAVHIAVDALPVFDGANALLQRGYTTRASGSNRSFSEAWTDINEGVDPERVEFAFDAQTSGGLLISLPSDRAAALVEQARAAGATAACVIGSVAETTDRTGRVHLNPTLAG